jgi:hypothetical protein
MDCDADGLVAFGDFLRGLISAEAPDDRVLRHLVRLDVNELWRFAFHNPQFLRVELNSMPPA